MAAPPDGGVNSSRAFAPSRLWPAGALTVTSNTFDPMRPGVTRKSNCQPPDAADKLNGASTSPATADPAVPAAAAGGRSVITAAAKRTAPATIHSTPIQAGDRSFGLAALPRALTELYA